MLQNAYFVAKIGADTAENEQHFAEILPTDAPDRASARVEAAAGVGVRGRCGEAAAREAQRRGGGPPPRPRTTDSICIFRKCIFRKCIFRNFCKFLAGSFSAVSKRNFARKYAFDSIFQALQDLHPFAPLQSQNFRKKSV